MLEYKENKRIDGPYDIQAAATCINGTFVGKSKDGVVCFKGIPFAKPPVGSLRWKDPEPVDADDGVYEAYHNACSPLQSKAETERASLYKQSEDCLYLNIWTAENYHYDNRTVMVFIHGGAYGWGGTADPLYDGYNFVKKHPNIVLVTITYRIGIMGFMDFSEVPGGEKYRTSGNLGLLDQIEALRYINRNIRSFGGDPGNVTIFGESAGGGSVSLLPLIPQTKGLFGRFIAESGSLSLTYSKEECISFTERLLRHTDAKTMDELCKLSEEELKSIIDILDDTNYPERDGIVLPVDLYDAYRSGASAHVDMLIGTNQDEMRYWIQDLGGLTAYRVSSYVMYENDRKKLKFSDLIRADRFIRQRRGRRITKRLRDTPWIITELYNELIFRLPAIRQAEYHSANGGNTYMYYWKYPSTLPKLGACHAVELAYIFGNLNDTIYTGSYANEELSEKVQDMWVSFAENGDPSTDDHKWKKYSRKDRSTMILDIPIRSVENIRDNERKLLMPLTDYYLNGNTKGFTANIPFVYVNLAVLAALLGGIIGTLVYIFKKKK